MDEPQRGIEHPDSGGGHEESDVSIRPLAVFLAGLAAIVVVAGAVVAGMFAWFETGAIGTDPEATPRMLADEAKSPPGPRLQVNSTEDLAKLRAREAKVLGATEWIDKERGIARIPIERAMEIAAEGMPAWPEAGGEVAGDGGQGTGADQGSGDGSQEVAPVDGEGGER